ncbi:unnamed protein product, partial [Prorocentrum cordatum]
RAGGAPAGGDGASGAVPAAFRGRRPEPQGLRVFAADAAAPLLASAAERAPRRGRGQPADACA